MFSDQRHSRRRLTEGMYVILALFTTSRLFIDVITSLRDVYCHRGLKISIELELEVTIPCAVIGYVELLLISLLSDLIM